MAITKIPTELIDTTSHMDFLDGEKLRLGTSNDLQLYHDGTHSYLASSTGSLYARTGNTFQIENQSGSEDLATFAVNGAVTLYYDGSAKLATSNSGVTVTGDISGTTATAAGGTSTTALASTAFVQQELTTLIGGAPSTLNDLNELAAAINDDANYNSTLTTALATKLPLAGGTMTGNLAVEKSANPIISVTETGAGAVTIQGTGSGGRVYSNSGNKLLLGAGGQNSHLIINTAGNVGIGTDDPDQPLHVKGTRPVRLERAGVGEFEISIDNVVTGDSLDFVVEPVSGSVSAGFQVRTRQTDGTLLSSFSVNHDGKVGIGTIEPEGGLHLHNYGSQYAELILERDSTGVEAKFDIKPYAGSLYIREYTTSGSNSTNDIIQITDTGHFLPISTSQDIGSTAKPWRNIFTQDLVLSNEKRETGNDVDGTKGNWTIQEGEEHLYIINNKSGKKYKFALEEIE